MIITGLKMAWRDKTVDLPTASQDVHYLFPIEEELRRSDRQEELADRKSTILNF